MTDFRFAEPAWGMLLWGVLAFTIALLWLEARAGGTLARFVSPLMQARLVRSPSVARRRTSIALLGLSLAFGVLALMRPQWGVQLIATPRVGAEIMVCLDVSNSMLAEDVAPNRLERAKAEIRDLLTYLHGDSVGLIAFAGRASVLAPITPDFSFLRLVLDSTGPRSVSRGGTRLEEPIRKAVAGFGAAATVSRSIILITDGEDHDSFPLEAAKAAAERGIKVLAIGFGDEAGSPIRVTDPKTGAKKSLRDSDGKEVISRLDGDTLREIALATGGAYVPAGTGVLDLESIYRQHIAGLTRGSLDGQSRTVRNEAYQWAVLASLLMLVASVVVGAGGAGRPRAAGENAATGTSTAGRGASSAARTNGTAKDRATSSLAAALLLIGSLFGGDVSSARAADAPAAAQVEAPAEAQSSGGDPEEAKTPGDEEQPAADGEATGAATPEAPPPPAREVYNDGLVKLEAGDLDAAEKLFEDARSRAGFDGLLRRDATYDLGVLDARRADAVMESKPEDALAALERSASWFRETVSLDAKDSEARHNLELVLRRALVLADAIARKNEKTLLDDIGALMEEQRAFLGGLRTSMQEQADQGDSADPERARRAFRELATKQLELSSRAEDLSERAGREQATIRSKPAEQQTPEDAMKAVQLDGVLESLHKAREQMGQARGRLRRVEGPGSYRAASSTLTELKRARDRLLDPVRVLDILIADTLELTRLTGVKLALDSGSTEVPPQKWLTPEHLTDSAGEMRERVEELHYGFVSGVAQADAAANGDTSAMPAATAEQTAFLERVREAEPLLGEAVTRLADAKSKLEQAQVRDSLEPQYLAVTKLAAARERFLDLQRLIELLYQDEQRIAGIVSPRPEEAAGAQAGPQAPMDITARAEYAPMAAEIQRSNVERGARVDRSLKEEIAAAEAAVAAKQAEAAAQQQPGQDPAAAGQQQGPDPAAQKQRLDLAATYLLAARGALDAASGRLDELAGQAEVAPPPLEAWQPSQAAVAEAVGRIEDLRRLFFSVVDHLKELAQRQIDLGDRTEETAALASATPDRDYTDKAGPLAARQDTLSTTAAPLAEELRAQSQQPVPPEAQGQVPEDLPQRLAQAAGHVDNARTSMDAAVQSLGINPPAFADTRASQNTALQELAAAIQLLQPPQQDQQQQQQDQQEQEQKDQQGGGEEEKKDDAQQQPGGQPQKGSQEKQEDKEKTDPAQLLQGIRDREAQRRADRDKAEKQGYEPVEKDW